MHQFRHSMKIYCICVKTLDRVAQIVHIVCLVNDLIVQIQINIWHATLPPFIRIFRNIVIVLTSKCWCLSP